MDINLNNRNIKLQQFLKGDKGKYALILNPKNIVDYSYDIYR
jgi:hypothetical protein